MKLTRKKAALFGLLTVAACGGSEGTQTDQASSHAGHAGQGSSAELADDFKGCPASVPAFAPGLRAEGKHFAVTLVSSKPEVPERYTNSWTVSLSTLDGQGEQAGQPAQGLAITRAQTFMPVHGHDGRVVPVLTPQPTAGEVLIDKLNFSMRGPWQVRLWLRSDSVEEDYVVFLVCVAK
jgi:hypothetical protein